MAESLFLKYGGSSLLTDVVEDFYAKAIQHEGLEHYFAEHDIERLKNHQAAFLAVLMGAPPSLYSGRGMKEAHHHLHITNEAFDMMSATLADSLRHGGMEESDINVMLEMLERFRGEVVSSER